MLYIILPVLLFILPNNSYAFNLSDYFIYQNDVGSWTLHDRNTLDAGLIGSNNEVKIHDDNLTRGVMGGSDLTLHDDNTVNGDATFNGSVTLNSGNTVTGTTSSGGVPNTFTPIALPTPTVFVSGGANVTTGGALAPGSYGDLTQGGTLTLDLISGDYYFDSIDLNNGNTINIDLTGGPVNIYITGDFDIHDSNNFVLTGGSASDIYMELYGKWSAHNDNTWYGIVYAPNEFIKFHDRNEIYGAFYSGEYVDIHNDNGLHFVSSEPPAGAVPEPLSLALMSFGLLGGSFLRKIK